MKIQFYMSLSIFVTFVAANSGQGVSQGAEGLASGPVASELEAANSGDVQAELSVGKAYYGETNVRRNYREAVKWFVKAASQGSAEAEAWLGSCYLYGHGVPQDSGKAKF